MKYDWDDFYNGIYDWAPSTIKSRMYSVTNFNTATGGELVDFVCTVEDEKVRNYVTTKILQAGVKLTKDEYMALGYEMGFELIGPYLMKEKFRFTFDELEMISFDYDIDDDFYLSRSDKPVEREVVYIEPKPEKEEKWGLLEGYGLYSILKYLFGGK